MEKWIGKVVVVTGASSGIGAALVEELVKHGLKVVGLARRIDRMSKLASDLIKYPGTFHPLHCDLSNTMEIRDVFEDIREKFGGVDILINNAGCGSKSSLIDGPIEENKRIIDTNVTALTHCTQEAVRSMIDRNVHGHIIHINSIYGHIVPLAKHLPNTYTATKFAVTALAETLRQELLIRKYLKIKVTSVSPGLTDTELVRDDNGAVLEYIKGMPLLAPTDIVNAVLYVLGTPSNVQVQELTIRPVGEPI